MTQDTKVRVSPSSKESEMMILGCMLTSINALNTASDFLNDSDFYYTEHKIIFSVLKEAYRNEKPSDLHLVCEELKRQDKLKSVGGVAYITTLAQYAGTSGYIEEYIEIIRKKTILRKTIEVTQQIEKKAYEDSEDSSELLSDFESKLSEINKLKLGKNKFQFRSLKEIGEGYLKVKPENKKMLLDFLDDKGVPRGFLPKGIVAMFVGAGGVGKTHFLAQLAISMASGTPFIGHLTTTKNCGDKKRGNVFLGLGENQDEDIERILFKASKKLRENQPDIVEEDLLDEVKKRIFPYSFCGQQASFIIDGKPSQYFKEFKKALIENTPAEGWTLIILDPVSRILGADAETDNAAATQFIALLEELTSELKGNPTILFAHHVNKSALNDPKQNQGAARGSSALTDGVRWQCNLSKGEDGKIKLKMTKSNFTAILDDIEIEKESDGYLIKTPSQKKHLFR